MNPYLTNVLPHTPAILRRLVQSIPPDKLDVPTYEGRFSVREAIAHLSDWEPILLERMKQTLDNPGSEIKGIDEGEMAVANGYSQKDLSVELDKFERSRAETVRFLQSVPADAWNSYATHNERGKQTLYDQANLLLGHDLYHVEQISKML